MGAFHAVRGMSREEIRAKLTQPSLLEQLIDAVCAGVDELQHASAATGAELNHKFHLEASAYEMAFGSLDLFFEGLEGIIGPPVVLHGSLVDAMQADHTAQKDADLKFTSSNGMTTTSALEWEFVDRPDVEAAQARGRYPERAAFKTRAGEELLPELCRRPRSRSRIHI